MSNSETSLVLAIDGGGTRCRVAVGGQKPVVVETGPANISTDFDGAIQEIHQGLARLADQIGRPLETLWTLPAFVGLAGITGPESAGKLRAALPFHHLRIEDDRPAALRGALGRQDGVIAHCGTGSFFAAQTDGQMRFAGGWGPAVGDEASAQWVGRLALRFTLESVDGRREPTPLTRHILTDFASTAGIVRFAGTARPVGFGALAPLVTDFAAHDDATAITIMQAGADEIARALPHLGWRNGHLLCLTGGIAPHYTAYLPDDIRASIVKPEGQPLDGALSLARDLPKENAHERD